MTPLQNAIWIIATACIVFLIVAHFRKKTKTWQRGRDILLVISCALDSGVFFYTGHYWLGIAYAIPAVAQTQFFISSRRKPSDENGYSAGNSLERPRGNW